VAIGLSKGARDVQPEGDTVFTSIVSFIVHDDLRKRYTVS
jgi:hypothetical protein